MGSEGGKHFADPSSSESEWPSEDRPGEEDEEDTAPPSRGRLLWAPGSHTGEDTREEALSELGQALENFGVPVAIRGGGADLAALLYDGQPLRGRVRETLAVSYYPKGVTRMGRPEGDGELVRPHGGQHGEDALTLSEKMPALTVQTTTLSMSMMLELLLDNRNMKLDLNVDNVQVMLDLTVDNMNLGVVLIVTNLNVFIVTLNMEEGENMKHKWDRKLDYMVHNAREILLILLEVMLVKGGEMPMVCTVMVVVYPKKMSALRMERMK